MGTSLLAEIVGIIGSGIGQLGQNIASGIGDFVKALFLETTGSGSEAVTHLSTFGVVICVFAGIALAIGMCRLIFGWIKSMGAR